MMKLLRLAMIVLLAAPVFATTYYVNGSTGSNSNTCVQAQSTSTPKLTIQTGGISCMGTADTVVVYAGTYSESLTVPAGAGSGSYNTVTINGSDAVTVTGSITMASHTKVNGFASTGCFATGASTDAYITNNKILSGCSGTKIDVAAGATFIYIQNNTLAGPCGGCDGVRVQGSHVLIENNDISRYRLGVNCYCSFTNTRNNTFHDQYETDSGQHTDAWFAEPDSGHVQAAQFNVIEANYQTNAIGANAKGFLFQGDACGANCFNAIVRFNSAYHIGGTYTTNDLTTFNFVKEYNNTWVDTRFNGYSGFFTNYYVNSNASDLNSIFYYPASVNNFNPYACDSSVCASMTYGHALFWCTGTCGTIFGHQYNSGSWLSDPGNKTTDPLFINYSTQNFHLQSGSPAIAAGTFLTTVAAGDSGSGTSLVVADASYLQDGMGLQNPNSTVQGDCISVTTVGNHVCITAVNYSTNTLTMASGFSRSVGDSVWLYSKSDGTVVLTGTAPDMGAYPYSASGPPAPSGSLMIMIAGDYDPLQLGSQ